MSARGTTDPIPPVHRVPRALLSVLVVLDRGKPNAGRAEHLDMVRQQSPERSGGVGQLYSNDDSIRNQGLEGERHVVGSLGYSRVSQRGVYTGGQDRVRVSKSEANRYGGRGILRRYGETGVAVLVGSPRGVGWRVYRSSASSLESQLELRSITSNLHGRQVTSWVT